MASCLSTSSIPRARESVVSVRVSMGLCAAPSPNGGGLLPRCQRIRDTARGNCAPVGSLACLTPIARALPRMPPDSWATPCRRAATAAAAHAPAPAPAPAAGSPRRAESGAAPSTTACGTIASGASNTSLRRREASCATEVNAMAACGPPPNPRVRCAVATTGVLVETLGKLRPLPTGCSRCTPGGGALDMVVGSGTSGSAAILG